MKHLRIGAFALIVATSAAIGVATASATTLEVGGSPSNSSLSITASLVAGGTTSIQDTSGLTGQTCKGLVLEAASATPFTGSTVTAPISSMTPSGCSHKTSVLKPGTIHIAWTSGTNGSVSVSGSEVTLESTIFGTSCVAKTGTGTSMGSITGTPAGFATWDLSGVVPMGICGEMVLASAVRITSPGGLGIGS